MCGCRIAVAVFTAVTVGMSMAPAAPLYAQESSRVELVIGGVSGVGGLLPIGTRWAIRPDLSISGLLQYQGGFASSPPRSSTRIGAGLSTLRFLNARSDSLRPYLLARAGYLTTRSSQRAGEAPVESFEVQAALGAGMHFRAHDQVGIFAELLADYTIARTSVGGSLPIETSVTRWNLRPAVGVSLRRARRN